MNLLTLYIFGFIPVFLALFVYFEIRFLKENITLGVFMLMVLMARIPFFRELAVLVMLAQILNLDFDTVLFKAKK